VLQAFTRCSRLNIYACIYPSLCLSHTKTAYVFSMAGTGGHASAAYVVSAGTPAAAQVGTARRANEQRQVKAMRYSHVYGFINQKHTIVHLHIYICIDIYIHHTYIHMSIHICAYMYTNMYLCIYASIYEKTHVCISVSIYVYTYIRLHLRTSIFICMCI